MFEGASNSVMETVYKETGPQGQNMGQFILTTEKTADQTLEIELNNKAVDEINNLLSTKSEFYSLGFGMFIGSFLFSTILVFLFSIEVATFSVVDLMIPILVVSLVTTIVEAITPKGLDNLTITIAAIIMVLLLPSLGLYWPFPMFSLF